MHKKFEVQCALKMEAKLAFLLHVRKKTLYVLTKNLPPQNVHEIPHEVILYGILKWAFK